MERWVSLEHTSISKLHGVCYTHLNPNLPTLVSSFCSRGSVLDWLQRERSLSYSSRRYLIKSIAEGIDYLHSREPPIIHGGINPSNILVGDDGQAKIAGFEGAFWDDAAQEYELFDVRFAPPEYLDHWDEDRDDPIRLQFSKKGDVYSFGLTAIQIASGNEPFRKHVDYQIAIRVPEGMVLDRHHYKEVPNDLWEVAERCWAFAPNERPNMSQVAD
ncbi:hypothetical protein JAAARDRAFT_41045 [Jaapia argillacea MUCL 33604]|uniref:Protein kinase domain-containing protein n=1 Tax=Jaapia argillacea MUCL 33604 TaxID=933084 RepID=A0A067P9Z6_9AGAM|nr:hypothetical protein JAAARDRAFT_41045 [Jaapia argillacea MUCL 33604]